MGHVFQFIRRSNLIYVTFSFGQVEGKIPDGLKMECGSEQTLNKVFNCPMIPAVDQAGRLSPWLSGGTTGLSSLNAGNSMQKNELRESVNRKGSWSRQGERFDG